MGIGNAGKRRLFLTLKLGMCSLLEAKKLRTGYPGKVDGMCFLLREVLLGPSISWGSA